MQLNPDGIEHVEDQCFCNPQTRFLELKLLAAGFELASEAGFTVVALPHMQQPALKAWNEES